MNKILGIDYGSSKIGLAMADTETKMAIPLLVVEEKNFKEVLKDLIKSEAIGKIVVGLPVNLNSQETAQTREVRQFIEQLKSLTNLEIVTEDERFSTAQAKRGESPTKLQRSRDDAVAAMYILQSHLDRTYGPSNS